MTTQGTPYLSASVVLLLSIASHLPISLKYDFDWTLDDLPAIVHNRNVRSSELLGTVVTDDFWGMPLARGGAMDHGSWRPATTLCFWILGKIQGTLEHGMLFKCVSALVHSVNAFLLCILIFQVVAIMKRTFQSAFVEGELVPFLSGCIFAVHPVTIEAIVSAVSLGDLLWHTVLLIMVQVQLTFWSLHDFTAVGRITLHVLRTTAIETALYVLACLIKETAIIAIPLFCLCVDGAIFLTMSYGHLRPIKRAEDKSKRGESPTIREDLGSAASPHTEGSELRQLHTVRLYVFFKVCVYIAMAVNMLFLRALQNGFQAPKFSALDNPLASPNLSRMDKSLALVQVHGIAFLKLIWPVDLSCDYSSPGSLPVFESLLGPRLIPGLALYVSMVWIVSRACRDLWMARRVRQDCQVLSFLCLIGMLLGASSYLPASNLLVVVGYLLSDRGLYGAAMGYSIILSCALTYAYRRLYGDGFCKRALTSSIIALTLGCFLAQSVRRTFDWQSSQALWSSAYLSAPNSSSALDNLAMMAMDKEDFDEAIRLERLSLKSGPGNSNAIQNLANALYKVGEVDQALDLVVKVIKSNPENGIAFCLHGLILKDKGLYDSALQSFESCSQFAPFAANGPINKGNMYLNQFQDPSRALECYEEAIRRESRNYQAHFNMGVVLASRFGRFQEAERYYLTAIEIEPQRHEPRANLEAQRAYLASQRS